MEEVSTVSPPEELIPDDEEEELVAPDSNL
jgi:hypothetical protein